MRANHPFRVRSVVRQQCPCDGSLRIAWQLHHRRSVCHAILGPGDYPLRIATSPFAKCRNLEASAYHPETGTPPFSGDGSESDGMLIWQHVQANGRRSEARRKSSGRSTRAGDSAASLSCRKCSSTAASASWFKVARTRRAILSAGAIADGDCQMRCISMFAAMARRMGGVKRVA
jgi:hypothetical protein